MAIKNIWSLNIDEALVIDKIKQELKKDYEVFMPANAQLKDIDLLLFNLKKKKVSTMQVKGSRTYEPKKSEIERYGEGSAAWITIRKDSIFKPKYNINFFIFVLHNFINGNIKKEIKIDYLIIPTSKFRELVLKKKIRKGNKYHFFIWIDSKGKRVFDFNNRKEIIPYSKYLNDWDLLRR